MAKKRRRSRKASKRQRRQPQWDQWSGRLKAWMANARLKGWVIAGIAAIAAVLIVALALFDKQTGIYVTVLVGGSLGLLVWTLPRARLGLTAVFLFLQPLVIYLPNTEYGYTKAILSLIAISLLWAIWAGRWIWKGEAKLDLTRLVWPILGVLGAALLSLVNANTLWGDLQYVVLMIYFAGFMLYVVNHVERREEVELLLGTLLGAAALASIYGLLQYFGVLLGAPGASGKSQAIISTFGNRNYLGGFLAYLVAPGLWVLLAGRSTWMRSFALVVLALMTATLVTIDSDSSWLAYVLSVLVVIVGLVSTRDWAVLKRTWRWSAGLAGVAFGLAILIHVGTQLWLESGPIWPESWKDIAPVVGWAGLLTLGLVPLSGLLERVWEAPLRRRLEALVGAIALAIVFLISPLGQTAMGDIWQVATQGTAQIRAWDWWVGWHMFTDHPITGTGIGDYKREFLPYKAEFLQTDRGQFYLNEVGYIQRAAQAHNEYVQITAETGILGILATGALIVVLVGGALRRIRHAEALWKRIALLGLLGGVVAFMSDSIFSFPLHLPANALALVTLVGLIHSPVFGTSPWRVTAQGTRAQVLAGVVILLALVVSVFAYRDWRADVLLDAAQQQLQASGGSAQAEDMLQRSAQLAVAPGEVFYWLGRIRVQEGESLQGQGNTQAAQRQFEQARQYLEEAVDRFSTELVYYHLAVAHSHLKDFEQARAYIDMLLDMDPSDSTEKDTRRLQAMVLYNQGEEQQGIQAMRGLMERYPRSPEIRFLLAQMLGEQGQIGTAQSQLETALRQTNQEIARLERRLNPREETTVQRSDYLRWQNEKQRLQQLRNAIRGFLDRLPP